MSTVIKPYNTGAGKKQEVEQMFDRIAPRYDFLNHFFSFGIDRRWRRKCIRLLKPYAPVHLLDVATGTADFAIEAARGMPAVQHIIGADISAGMLAIGRSKVKQKGLDKRIELVQCDSEKLPFADSQFDAFTAGFGVRNFEHLEAGLAEMCRVLKSGGTGIILEFSKPAKFPMKQLFSFYFRVLMPLIGRLVSRDRRAYSYLPESVAHFPDRDDMVAILHKAGFAGCTYREVSGGIACIYLCRKP